MADPTPTTAIGLDVGSNTISCCRIVKKSDGTIAVDMDTSMPVRLSEGLAPGGQLKSTAIMRGLVALEQLAKEFAMDTHPVFAVGTAVLRMTATPELFTKPAGKILGVPVQIIDGKTEARITSTGAIAGLPAREDWIMLDIGGQSTELCRLGKDGIWQPLSMPLGVVGLTEKFLPSDIPGPDELVALCSHVANVLDQHVSNTTSGTLVCVGGTVTTLSMLEQGIGWERETVHGSKVHYPAAVEWLQKIATVTAKQRIEQWGLRPMRADVFPAGICVLLEVMKKLGLDETVVSANGLRVGLARQALGL